MNKTKCSVAALLALSLSACTGSDEPKALLTVSFEGKLNKPESTFTPVQGDDYGDFGYKVTAFKDNQSLIECNSYFHPEWGFGGGFTYTNTTDTTTPGYTNLSAAAGKGVNESTYLTVSLANPAVLTNLHPESYRFRGAYTTNTTYAYLAVTDGNDGGGMVKGPFTDGDYFYVEAIGYAADSTEIGKSTFYLADFRNGKKSVVNNWQWFDWTPLADAAYITFAMASTDNGPFGMNTPNYFCLDGITLEAK